MRSIGINFVATASIAAVGNTDIKAAVAGKKHWLQRLIISMTTYASTGTLSVWDGTTTYVGPILATTGNGGVYTFDFGERGIDFGVGLAINLVNATSNVGASVTAIGYTTG